MKAGWIIAHLLLALAVKRDAGEYVVETPSEFTAFTGKFYASFKITGDDAADDVNLQLVHLPSTVLSTIPTGGVREAQMGFLCGLIDRAGRYEVRLVDGLSGSPLGEPSSFRVSWPRISLLLPSSEHEALTGRVALKFVNDLTIDPKCSVATANYSLDMLFIRNSSAEGVGPTPTPVVLSSVSIPSFVTLQSPTYQFDCSLFDQPGVYNAEFKSSLAPDAAIATSNPLTVSWSQDYALSTSSSFVLPCQDYVEVDYRQPDCPGTMDKIRLYKYLPTVNSSLLSPRKEVYVMDKTATPGSNTVVFYCDEFDKSALEFCFKYDSISSHNGAVMTQYTTCIPQYEIPNIDVDGGWTDWSEWNTCTRTCGGGIQHRFRSCENPPPSGRGKDCGSDMVEQRPCATETCIVSTTPSLISITPTGCLCDCACGCQVAGETRGVLVASTLRCRDPSVTWIISAPKGHIINLVFNDYRVNSLNPNTVVFVKDGKTSGADLLVKDDGSVPPSTVHTSGSSIMVEFISGWQGLGDRREEGFVATFISYPDNTTAVIPPDPNTADTIWSSAIIAVGVLLLIFIICVVVGFLCYHRKVHKRRKHAEKTHRPTDVLLSNGEAPASPASVINKGSTNMSYRDSMVSPARLREYIKQPQEDNSPHNLDTSTPTPVPHSHRKNRRKRTNAHGGSDPSSPVTVHREGEEDAGSSPSSSLAVHISSSQGYVPVSQVGSPQHGPGKYASRPAGHSARDDSRNRSFIAAVGQTDKQLPPLAGQEDLTPQSPVDITNDIAQYARSRDPRAGPGSRYSRPPGDGTEAVAEVHTRLPGEHKPHPDTDTGHYVPQNYPDIIAANQTPRPYVKQLPLRHIERPDGQSPDNRPSEGTSLGSSSLSPMLQESKLFPDSSKTPSEFDLAGDDFEYDDYVPNLPGSFFHMDPSAYTLTWSKHPRQPGRVASPKHVEIEMTDPTVSNV